VAAAGLAAPSYFNEDLSASSSQTSPSSSSSSMGHRPPGHRGIVSPQPSAAGDNGYNGYDDDDEDGVDDSQIVDESMNLSLSELQDAAARAQVSCLLWMIIAVE